MWRKNIYRNNKGLLASFMKIARKKRGSRPAMRAHKKYTKILFEA